MTPCGALIVEATSISHPAPITFSYWQLLATLRVRLCSAAGRISRAGSRCCGGVRAQEHREDRARAWGALNIKKSAVPVEDVLDDREPEPGPAHLARTRGIDAIEALGQPRQMLACDTVSAVAHGYRNKWASPAIAAV